MGQSAAPATMSTDILESVAKASARTYEGSGHAAQVYEHGGLGPVLYEVSIPALGRVEIVELAPPEGDEELVKIRERRDAGVDIWAIVALEHLAAAHAKYRKVADRLQPWWIVDDQVVFGTPRVP